MTDHDAEKASSVASSDTNTDGTSDAGSNDSSSLSLHEQPWLHAAYHTVTSVQNVSVAAVLSHSFAYLGWAGGIILFLAATAMSYYSGMLLINLQQSHETTYSEIANRIMSPHFSRYFIRPIQGLQWVIIIVAEAILIGESFYAIDEICNQGEHTLSLSLWIAISGVIIFLLALVPDLERMWQLSLTGLVAATAATFFLLAASGMAIGDGSRDGIQYGRPAEVKDNTDYVFGIFNNFGVIALGFGGHSVLPDLQATLHNTDSANAHSSMRKGLVFAYSVITPSYLFVAVLGYAAFGSDVTFLFDALEPYVSSGGLIVGYILMVIQQMALGSIYVQASFILFSDISPSLEMKSHKSLHFSHVVKRFLFIALLTFIAAAVPFFDYISGFAGAIATVPLTFVYPLIFWNRSELSQDKDVPKWRIHSNWVLIVIFVIIGVLGTIGALYSIADAASTFHFFQ